MTIVRMQDGEFVRHYLARLGRVNDGTSDQQLRARLRRLLGLAAICVAVPDLRAKLRALDRLPLTARAIREVTWQRRRSTDAKLL